MSCVLVVDDNPSVRDAVVSIMRDSGHQSLMAADGFEALDRCRSVQPDVVITDIFMSGMDGMDLIRVLRRRFPKTRIIAMSAGRSVPNLEVSADHADRDLVRTAAGAGADRVVAKSIEPAELVATVAELLSS